MNVEHYWFEDAGYLRNHQDVGIIQHSKKSSLYGYHGTGSIENDVLSR